MNDRYRVKMWDWNQWIYGWANTPTEAEAHEGVTYVTWDRSAAEPDGYIETEMLELDD